MFIVNAKRMKENLIFKHSNLCYEKIFLQLLIPSFAVVVIFISCKKDKEDNATKTEIERAPFDIIWPSDVIGSK